MNKQQIIHYDIVFCYITDSDVINHGSASATPGKIAPGLRHESAADDKDFTTVKYNAKMNLLATEAIQTFAANGIFNLHNDNVNLRDISARSLLIAHKMPISSHSLEQRLKDTQAYFHNRYLMEPNTISVTFLQEPSQLPGIYHTNYTCVTFSDVQVTRKLVGRENKLLCYLPYGGALINSDSDTHLKVEITSDQLKNLPLTSQLLTIWAGMHLEATSQLEAGDGGDLELLRPLEFVWPSAQLTNTGSISITMTNWLYKKAATTEGNYALSISALWNPDLGDTLHITITPLDPPPKLPSLEFNYDKKSIRVQVETIMMLVRGLSVKDMRNAADAEQKLREDELASIAVSFGRMEVIPPYPDHSPITQHMAQIKGVPAAIRKKNPKAKPLWNPILGLNPPPGMINSPEWAEVLRIAELPVPQNTIGIMATGLTVRITRWQAPPAAQVNTDIRIFMFEYATNKWITLPQNVIHTHNTDDTLNHTGTCFIRSCSRPPGKRCTDHECYEGSTGGVAPDQSVNVTLALPNNVKCIFHRKFACIRISTSTTFFGVIINTPTTKSNFRRTPLVSCFDPSNTTSICTCTTWKSYNSGNKMYHSPAMCVPTSTTTYWHNSYISSAPIWLHMHTETNLLAIAALTALLTMGIYLSVEISTPPISSKETMGRSTRSNTTRPKGASKSDIPDAVTMNDSAFFSYLTTTTIRMIVEGLRRDTDPYSTGPAAKRITARKWRSKAIRWTNRMILKRYHAIKQPMCDASYHDPTPHIPTHLPTKTPITVAMRQLHTTYATSSSPCVTRGHNRDVPSILAAKPDIAASDTDPTQNHDAHITGFTGEDDPPPTHTPDIENGTDAIHILTQNQCHRQTQNTLFNPGHRQLGGGTGRMPHNALPHIDTPGEQMMCISDSNATLILRQLAGAMEKEGALNDMAPESIISALIALGRNLPPILETPTPLLKSQIRIREVGIDTYHASLGRRLFPAGCEPSIDVRQLHMGYAQGDGNCFDRSVMKALTGNEGGHMGLRLRNSIHYAQFSDMYEDRTTTYQALLKILCSGKYQDHISAAVCSDVLQIPSYNYPPH